MSGVSSLATPSTRDGELSISVPRPHFRHLNHAPGNPFQGRPNHTRGWHPNPLQVRRSESHFVEILLKGSLKQPLTCRNMK